MMWSTYSKKGSQVMVWSSRYVRCWVDNISCPVSINGNLQLFSDEWRVHDRYVSQQRFAYSVDGLKLSDVALVLFQMIRGPSFTVEPRQERGGDSLSHLLADLDRVDRAREFANVSQSE